MELSKELIDKFKSLSGERIRLLMELVGKLEESPSDKALYDQFHQIFHKIHGSAAMYGFAEVGEIAGRLENMLLNRIRAGEDLTGEDVKKIIEESVKIRDEILGKNT